MIVDERLTAYIRSLEPEEPEAVRDIGEQARAQRVPIVKPETAALLRVLICMKNPQNILEIGAATGYSAILMSSCAGPQAHITTIENYEKRIPVCRENIRRKGLTQRITLLEGDAQNILPSLTPSYDFIFMDAAKAQYIRFLPEVMRLLGTGGVLAADNVLQEGSIIDSRFAVTRRDRTIHSRMREFLWQIKHDERLQSAVLSVGDGVSLSIRTG